MVVYGVIVSVDVVGCEFGLYLLLVLYWVVVSW